MYRVVGIDTRYGMKNCYGLFETLREATYYMDELKSSSLGAIIKFKIVEEHDG